jgi:glycosyltransferase involved in cell wall biosynthesis
MHVLRLTPHFYWPQLEERGWPVAFDTIGGMQTQIFRQALELSRMGVEQTVMSLRIPGVEPSWRINGHLHVQGVRVPVFPVKSRTRGMVDLNLSWSLGVVREIERLGRPVDIVHVHCSGVFWPLLVGSWAARRLHAPLVLTIHCSILGTYHPMHHLDRLLVPWARRIERSVVGGAAHTIALTPRSYGVMVQANYTKPGSISIVPDSVDVGHFRAQATPEKVARFAERFKLPEDRPIVTYVGRVAREKGWRHLLEMAERLAGRRVHFMVCGDGNECDLLREGIRERGLADRFTVTGYLPIDDIPLALANSQVLVLPSVHEEFGGVLIEAMAMGVPSVAFAVGGVPHVQRDGVTGLLVEPESVLGLCTAVERLLDDPELARHMGQASLAHVEKSFSLAAACRKLNDIYQRVAEAP